MSEDLTLVKNSMSAETILSSAQTMTGSWVDVGSPLEVVNSTSVMYFIAQTVNDSLTIKYRVLGLLNIGGAEKEMPIYTSGASSVAVAGAEYSYTVDEANPPILIVYPERHLGYLQLQVEVGTVGSTAGTVDEVNVTER